MPPVKLAAFEAIAAALRDAGVRYLVAGGVAVNAHGYLRLTYDVDLVIQLIPENIRPAFTALASLGYRPTVPVTAEQFSDEAQRARWIREKGMQVLNFHSDQYGPFTVDVFVSAPFDFESEYRAAMEGEIAPGLSVRFVSIPSLIAMKQLANRPRDLDDIEHLRLILEERDRK
jgi:Nucleotidyl transferase AbiEii toxin, Type IV TA system